MMISKSGAAEVITDYCLLLEKQTEGFSREELLETVKFLYRNRNSECNVLRNDSPEIELGEDMKTLYFRLPDNKREIINTDNFKVCVDYVGLIENRKNIKSIL